MLNKLRYWSRFIFTYKNWFSLILNRSQYHKANKFLLNNDYLITGSPKSPISTIMDETFLLRVYTPPFMKINKGDIVVDIGANMGDFSIFASLLGAKQVFAYEPDVVSYSDLMLNINNNKISNIKPINKAVSDTRGIVSFYHTPINGGNSLFESKDSIGKSKVKSIKISDIFEENKIDKIDFLKIDCEGSEGLIFKSTSRRSWSKIKKISLEYHDKASLFDHNELLNFLTSFGYKTSLKTTGDGFGYIYARRG